jgi:TonB-dependent receptor
VSQVRNSDLPQIKHRMIALAVASACAAMVPAFAQENPQSPTTDLSQPQAAAPANTVVVTGIRASMQSTLNLKKNSDGIVDGIVADDIGKFPDTNLAEAVQRISGVSIDRTNGEGSRVTIRGVGPDLNLILLNGRQMPTSNLNDRGSRSFDFANLASEAVSQIQVYKSARADSPTGGLGATLNIMTGRPLDLGNQTSVGAKIVYDKSNTNLPKEIGGKKITPEVSTLISRKFGTDDMFGVGLTASYQSRNSGTNTAAITDGWLGPIRAGDTTSEGAITKDSLPRTQNVPTTGIYNSPRNLSYYLNGVQRQRTNAQLTFQFRPIKDWTTTVDYTYARNKVQTRGTELNVWYNHGDDQSSVWRNGAVNSPLVYQESAPGGADFSMNGHDFATVSTLKSTGFNTQYRVNPALRLSFDAHHSVSDSGKDSPYGSENDLATAARGRLTNGIIFGQEMPIFYQDFDNSYPFQPTGSWFRDAKLKQTVDQFQAAANLKVGESSNLNFGVSSTKVKFASAYQEVFNSQTWGGVVKGDQQAARQYFDQSYWHPIDFRGYFSQLGGSGDPRLYSKMWLVDFDKVRQAAINLPASAAQAQNNYSPSLANPSEVRNLQEKSNALFAQFTHEWDTALPMHTGVGLRYEKTKLTSNSTIQPIAAVRWVSQNEFDIPRGVGVPLIQTHDYHYWLPSVDWDMDAFDNVKLRASYSTNLGRGRWNQLQGGASPVGNPTVGGQRLDAGNPALNPVKSKNIDLSAEWYYSKQSMASLGLFHKKLTGYAGSTTYTVNDTVAHTPVGGAYWQEAQSVKGCTSTDTYCLRDYILRTLNGRPGVTYTGESVEGGVSHATGTIVGQPGDPFLPLQYSSIANQKNASLKGAELNVQHMFNNGFGVQANYTYVKSDLKYDNTAIGDQFALVGLSNSANLVGIYEDQKWSVRLAYNWRGEFLTDTAANGRANPSYVEPYGQVDVSVGYNVNQNLSVSLEGINLTNATLRTHGRDELQVLRATTGGQRWMLGARYKF